jgi:hypothetical protein
VEKKKELKKREVEFTKKMNIEDKILKEAAKLQQHTNVKVQCAFLQKCSTKVVAQVGEELHQQIKLGTPPLPGAYDGKFVTFYPDICRKNQAIAKARMRAKQEDCTIDPVITTTPPPWMHHPDRRFFIDSDMKCNLEVP